MFKEVRSHPVSAIISNELSKKHVQDGAAVEPAHGADRGDPNETWTHADGGNLYLTISQTGGALSRRWTFMYLVSGKQREAGFGPLDRVTLAEARENATEWRRKLKKGIDPLDEKKATKEAEAARRTFGECADELITSKQSEWRSPIHGCQWRMTLDIYCKPLRDKPGVLKPLWQEIPETASRLRGRIEAVLDYAKAHDLRSGETATWKGHLALILPKRQKLSRSHHAALPYHEIPAFVAKLRERDSIPALALEFVI
jgi:Arm domain-containing DNA-binding protein/integrase-like protein